VERARQGTNTVSECTCGATAACHRNAKHGHGVLTWPHGAWFVWPFEDKRTGTGEYHYSVGHIYKGEYVDNVAHGRGVLTSGNGAVI
jgi:hypothetical protein